MSARATRPGPHCDGPDCGGPRCCDCDCAICTLLPLVMKRFVMLEVRLRSAQTALDVDGADRDTVARVAGRLLDLAEELARGREQLGGRFA